MLLECSTQRNGTVAGIASLCMVETDRDNSLAFIALLTPQDVKHDPLHPPTAGALTVFFPALRRVDQNMDEERNSFLECHVLQGHLLAQNGEIHLQVCPRVLVVRDCG